MGNVDTLPLRVKRDRRAIPDSDWPTLSSEAAAVRYAVEHSGLIDKSVAAQADIDPATLSKAKSGQARLSENDMDALMDATGLEAPLFAWLLRRGYDPRSLRRLETDVERENRELREQLSKLESDRQVELRLLKELRAAG